MKRVTLVRVFLSTIIMLILTLMSILSYIASSDDYLTTFNTTTITVLVILILICIMLAVVVALINTFDNR